MSNYYLSHSAAELDEAVDRILNKFQDVSSVTATADDVVTGKQIVDATGAVLEGTLDTQDYYNEGYSAGYEQGVADATPSQSTSTHAVLPISDASYGFSLNESGYWQSENAAVSSSYAICRVYFNHQTDTTVYFDCINYGESNYDYGLIGNIDTALDLSNTADSEVFHTFKGLQSEEIQTVEYPMTSGTHYIDVKYRKDSSVDKNNDTLQFKVRFA